jgi:hypothetical protein
MLQRAEQLKLMLCHRQAHYLTLIARGLLQLHQLELAEFEGPAAAAAAAAAGAAASCASALPPSSLPGASNHHQSSQDVSSPSVQGTTGTSSRARQGLKQQVEGQRAVPQQCPQAEVQHEKKSSLSALDLADELDDFFLPVSWR